MSSSLSSSSSSSSSTTVGSWMDRRSFNDAASTAAVLILDYDRIW
jgi:hypothetical protein